MLRLCSRSFSEDEEEEEEEEKEEEEEEEEEEKEDGEIVDLADSRIYRFRVF